MTEFEIIKALECCASGTSSEACEGCPFNENDICDKESNATEKYALDLINRQKADIEKKDIEIDILIRKKEALNDEILDLKAEVEETQKNSETLAIALIKAKAEVERLQQKYELSEAEREANVKGFAETLETVRAEAIKEFAERLKVKKAIHYCKCGRDIDTTDIVNNYIDNLAEEMTEGNHEAL